MQRYLRPIIFLVALGLLITASRSAENGRDRSATRGHWQAAALERGAQPVEAPCLATSCSAPGGCTAARGSIAGGVTLGWDLEEPGLLSLDIFDLRGRRVANLLCAAPVAARGSLAWNGTDDQGQALPGGIYLVRLQAGQRLAAVHRIILAR